MNSEPLFIGPMLRTPPWRMCRSCHRVGVKHSWLTPRCTHPVGAVGMCGQCGKNRPLIECHSYDFRPAVPVVKPPRIRRTTCPTCGAAVPTNPGDNTNE